MNMGSSWLIRGIYLSVCLPLFFLSFAPSISTGYGRVFLKGWCYPIFFTRTQGISGGLASMVLYLTSHQQRVGVLGEGACCI